MIVLIVDDQENMCWILSKILSNAGFSVKTANTAKEAISIANENKISAAIIDYRLPDSNGFDLFLNLRKQNENIPCLLITSYGSNKLSEDAFKLGFDSYFDKPFDNGVLIAALKKSLNIRDPMF